MDRLGFDKIKHKILKYKLKGAKDMIIKDDKFLQFNEQIKQQGGCKKVSLEEGDEIAVKLLQELKTSKTGIGIAAPQLGIDAQVMVVNVKKPLVFINPEILSLDDEVLFKEACLSFPNKYITTNRHKWVQITCDNLQRDFGCGKAVVCGPTNAHMEDDGEDPDGLWESVCIQHEYDHLQGITMYDRRYIAPQAKSEKVYGRNEKVILIKGEETKTIKYKKAEQYLNDGWIIQ